MEKCENVKFKSFLKMHPVIGFVYVLLMLIFTMSSLNPMVISTMFVISITYMFLIFGRKSLKELAFLSIPVFFFACIIIPLFSHNGVTPIFYINDMAVTVETVIYGVVAGTMLLSVIMWVRVASYFIDNEKFLYLVGKVFPKISLLLSIAIRTIPLLIRRYKEIKDAQIGIGNRPQNMNIFNKIRFFAHNLSILISWSLENSINTSVSMESRGYGVGRRTSFNLYKFRSRDAVSLLIMLAIAAYPMILTIQSVFRVNYFPAMDMCFDGLPEVIGVILMALTALLPVFFVI